MIKHLFYLILILGLSACKSQNQDMLLTNSQIQQLDSLIKMDKFDDKAFKDRGLIASELQLRNKMNKLLNECLEEIIEKSQNGTKPINIAEYLDKGLRRFNKIEYDTEE